MFYQLSLVEPSVRTDNKGQWAGYVPAMRRNRGGNMKSRLTLIGLEIEGKWNIPLLKNAADMSGASLLFVQSKNLIAVPEKANELVSEIDELMGKFDQVLVCEATKRSRTVYEFPAPRGSLGLIVGNELNGIPTTILKKADQIVSIPMLGQGMSSVNVAVASAIILYVVEKDLGRMRFRTSALSHRNVDILVLNPPDPSELGSLLRSAWAFGWKKIFLADRGGVWFTKDRQTIMAGRAAARCEVNRIVVCPLDHVNFQNYEQIVVCGKSRSGTPLSRFTLPDHGNILFVYGDDDPPLGMSQYFERIYVDQSAVKVDACFRHAGSILLSVISQRLRRVRRG
jgi:tRNA G18 (ribose-2'-O)-methylase SpoU